MFILLLLNIFPTSAQDGFVLNWDSEVGCLDYDEDRKGGIPLEDLLDEDCLLVCKDSEVNFYLEYDEGDYDVAMIEWEVIGGHVVSGGNGNPTALIEWLETTQNGSVSLHLILGDGTEIYTGICVEVKPGPEADF